MSSQNITPKSVVELHLRINGAECHLMVDARSSLLDVLREELQMTGTKKGCDHGQCGACTVHLDGRRALACLTLAASVRGEVTTIEGLATEAALHPMQQAFIDFDAFQCGYCTSGQIMSAISCVQEGNAGSDDEVREHMSGNLCRCGAYSHIVAAIRHVASAQSSDARNDCLDAIFRMPMRHQASTRPRLHADRIRPWLTGMADDNR